MIRWPDDERALDRARAEGAPRLLLVDPDAPAPLIADQLEDWVRLPAEDGDVRARVRTLERRAADRLVPTVDDTGVVRFGDDWVGLSPVEHALARALVERFGAVVGREVLVNAAWDDDRPSRNALDVHILRLRRRLDPLGLEIRTVRARGYLLQESAVDHGSGSARATGTA